MLLFSPECGQIWDQHHWNSGQKKSPWHEDATTNESRTSTKQNWGRSYGYRCTALWYSKQTFSSPHHFSRLCWVQTSSHIDHCLLSTHNTEPITSHVHIFTLPAVLVCFCICMTHFHPTYFYLEESVFLYNLCKALRMYWKERVKGCGSVCVE